MDDVLPVTRRSRIFALPRLGRKAVTRLLDLGAEFERHDFACLPGTSNVLACLDRTVWKRRSVLLSGWTEAGHPVAEFPPVVPAENQPLIEDSTTSDHDFARSPREGFEIELARPDPRALLTIRLEGAFPETAPLRIRPPGRCAEARARLRALPGVLRHIHRHRGEILRFLRNSEPGLSVALRDAFGFGDGSTPAPFVSPGIFGAAQVPRPVSGIGPTVILVPVWNAPDDTARLLARLPGTLDIPHRILLIDDGSDDPAIAPMLEAFRSRHPDTVHIERLGRNSGFVAAANRGLEIAATLGHHVILLNTDTLPPRGWAGRLLAPILGDPTVASVTPLSNTAEIASVPAQGVAVPLTEHVVDALDRVAGRFGPEWSEVPLPTGIGFAMAMNRTHIDRIGGFDPAFGRGYGEEVDWCHRARRAGGRHVLAANVYVGHAGGASFGSDEKRLRLQEAARRISRRHPGHDREVQEWAQAAPHGAQRAVLSLAWLGAVSPDPVPVFLGHMLGGGAEMSLKAEIDAALSGGAPGVVVVRAGGIAAWRTEIQTPDFTHACQVQDRPTLRALLAPLGARHIVYSCGVGARDAAEVPKLLLDLAAGGKCRLDLRLHDYFPLSPSYCLLDGKGRFRGVPDAADKDPAHILPAFPGRAGITLAQWRALWNRVLGACDGVTAFSEPSRALFLEVFPQATDRCRVAPHSLPPFMPGPLAPGGAAIGVLGGINEAKGAGVLVALARHFRLSGVQRRIVVLGEIDPAFRLPAPHMVTGRYDRTEIGPLAQRFGIGVWLIPSIWPETFSFTTREALATGLPVLTFDLGAQAEAARAAANGHVLAAPPDDVAELALQIMRHLPAQPDITR